MLGYRPVLHSRVTSRIGRLMKWLVHALARIAFHVSDARGGAIFTVVCCVPLVLVADWLIRATGINIWVALFIVQLPGAWALQYLQSKVERAELQAEIEQLYKRLEQQEEQFERRLEQSDRQGLEVQWAEYSSHNKRLRKRPAESRRSRRRKGPANSRER